MMEPEPVPAGPEEEAAAPEAQHEETAPADSSALVPAPEQPAPAPVDAAPADPAPAALPADPPPPPDTPRWAESAALTEIQPPAPAPVEAAPAVQAEPPAPVAFEAPPAPAAEVVPDPPAAPVSVETPADPVSFEAPPAPSEPAAPVAFEAPPEPPAAPVAFEAPPAPEAPVAVEAPAAAPAPVAFDAPPEPEATAVDPMFARAQTSAAPDQGWGVAEPPSFVPEPAEAAPQADVPPPPPPAPAAPFGAPEPPPAEVAPEPTAEVPVAPIEDNPAAEFAAAVEHEPEPAPEASFEAHQPLASVIPINVDGMWVAGRGRGSGGGGAKAPREKGAKGLRFKRSNAAGLEAVPDAPLDASPSPAAFPVDAPDDAAPAPAEEAPKRKRGAFGKEFSFGRKKKNKKDDEGQGGFPVAPVAAAGAAAATVSDGGFGEAPPPPPPAPGFEPAPGFGPPPPASGGDAGFAPDAGFGGSSGFGAPASASEGWREPIPGKKKRTLRLPSTSGGKFGRPTMIVLLVVALVAAALAYMFIGRGGGASQPAYALDFVAGQSYDYKVTMALNGQLTAAGQSIPLQETVGATMHWDVQSVDPNGVATVDVQLNDVTVAMNGKTVSTGELPDSAMHYTMKVASDGSLLSGGGLGALTGGGSNPTGDVPGTDQLTPLLPGHDVNPGDSWDKTYDSDLPYGMGHVHYVTHSTYVKNEDVAGVTTSVIASKMSLPLHMKVDLSKMLQEMGSGTGELPAGSHPVIIYGGHVHGTTTGWFDPKTKQMVKTSAEVQFRMAMTFRGLPAGVFPGNKMLFHGGIIISMQKV